MCVCHEVILVQFNIKINTYTKKIKQLFSIKYNYKMYKFKPKIAHILNNKIKLLRKKCNYKIYICKIKGTLK